MFIPICNNCKSKLSQTNERLCYVCNNVICDDCYDEVHHICKKCALKIRSCNAKDCLCNENGICINDKTCKGIFEKQNASDVNRQMPYFERIKMYNYLANLKDR